MAFHRLCDVAYGFGLCEYVEKTRLCSAVGLQDGRFLFTLGARDSSLFFTFGAGDRGLLFTFCLGAPLARMEAQIAINTLLRRMPDLRLKVSSDSLRWRPSMILRGLDTLPVVF